jgi:hypothetical protein
MTDSPTRLEIKGEVKMDYKTWAREAASEQWPGCDEHDRKMRSIARDLLERGFEQGVAVLRQRTLEDAKRLDSDEFEAIAARVLGVP